MQVKCLLVLLLLWPQYLLLLVYLSLKSTTAQDKSLVDPSEFFNIYFGFGATPDCAKDLLLTELRNDLWWCSGYHMGYQRSNLSQPHASQVPSSLYHHSGPSSMILHHYFSLSLLSSHTLLNYLYLGPRR